MCTYTQRIGGSWRTLEHWERRRAWPANIQQHPSTQLMRQQNVFRCDHERTQMIIAYCGRCKKDWRYHNCAVAHSFLVKGKGASLSTVCNVLLRCPNSTKSTAVELLPEKFWTFNCSARHFGVLVLIHMRSENMVFQSRLRRPQS